MISKLAAAPAFAALLLILGVFAGDHGRAEPPARQQQRNKSQKEFKEISEGINKIQDTLAELGETLAFYDQMMALKNAKKYEEAIAVTKKHIEIREKKYGKEHSDSLGARQYLGLIYMEMKRYGEAEAIFLYSLNGLSKADIPNADKIRQTQSHLGQLNPVRRFRR